MTYRPDPCRCSDCGLRIRFETDYYTLRNTVWNEAMTGVASGVDDGTCDGVAGNLHVVCAERSLGRELRRGDFNLDALVNFGVFGFTIVGFEP